MTAPRFDKVVCTGGSGRLGRTVVDVLRDRCDVTVLDLRPPEQEVPYVEADITDHAALVRAFAGQEAVIHLAAVPNPRTTTPEATFRTNVMGTWAVLDAAQEAGVRRVVVTSSDAATGLHYNPKDWGPQYLPIDEAHPLRPSENYSLSKQVTENVARAYAHGGKLEVMVIRPTHVVFEQEWPELRDRGADVDNYHLWSYVEPVDVAEAMSLCLGRPDGAYDTFFISAADTLSDRPTLEMFEERFGPLPEVRRPDLYRDRPNAAIWDITRAREVLGYEPRSDWRRLFAKVQ